VEPDLVNPKIRKLSQIDKKILKVLLSPDGIVSSHALTTKIGVPRTTIQRRRKFLEKHYLDRPRIRKINFLVSRVTVLDT
jgi:hypothetical protein